MCTVILGPGTEGYSVTSFDLGLCDISFSETGWGKHYSENKYTLMATIYNHSVPKRRYPLKTNMSISWMMKFPFGTANLQGYVSFEGGDR